MNAHHELVSGVTLDVGGGGFADFGLTIEPPNVTD